MVSSNGGHLQLQLCASHLSTAPVQSHVYVHCCTYCLWLIVWAVAGVWPHPGETGVGLDWIFCYCFAVMRQTSRDWITDFLPSCWTINSELGHRSAQLTRHHCSAKKITLPHTACGWELEAVSYSLAAAVKSKRPSVRRDQHSSFTRSNQRNLHC